MSKKDELYPWKHKLTKLPIDEEGGTAGTWNGDHLDPLFSCPSCGEVYMLWDDATVVEELEQEDAFFSIDHAGIITPTFVCLNTDSDKICMFAGQLQLQRFDASVFEELLDKQMEIELDEDIAKELGFDPPEEFDPNELDDDDGGTLG